MSRVQRRLVRVRFRTHGGARLVTPLLLAAAIWMLALMTGCGDDTEEAAMVAVQPASVAGARDTITVSGKGVTYALVR